MTLTSTTNDPIAERVSVLAFMPELATTLDAFAAGFGALAGLLLSAPNQDVLDRVRDPELLSQWPLPSEPESQRGVQFLHESTSTQEAIEPIRRDFNQLFGGSQRVLVSPYESVHRSSEGLLFDKETLQVREAYARFGLVVPRLNKEPDDHIGLELGFLSTLCVRALDCLEAQDRPGMTAPLEGIVSFLDSHLLAWAPDFFDRAEDQASTSFYRGVAALGSGTCVAAERMFGVSGL